MQRWWGLDELPSGRGRSVVTIGVFDGVHRGHRHIVARAVELARLRGLPSVVVTFDPHPSAVLRPEAQPELLTTPARRADLFEELGVDAVGVLPFTKEFSALSPVEFARTVLADALHAEVVVVGRNFRFGHRAAGDVEMLADLGSTLGFSVEVVTLVGEEHARFSSTRIRQLVAEGDVEGAARALGRPHRVEGRVVRGEGRGGRDLGYPTANLECPPHTALPGDGVYAGQLVVDGHALPAAISVGTNPTFDGTDRRAEAYVLDRDDLDLYGSTVAVDFVARIRAMERFDSVEALVERMADDVRRTRELLAS
ncbi:MAG: bifunctional riboflavin kinase/FAD synthetase [Carbonactinosporaceae bacterium]